jgi:cadmium resistance protein CadD (predicted permease)
VLELLGVTVATFFGTALDNLLMLVVLRISGTPERDIAGGFLLGSLVILTLCAAGSVLSAFVPVHQLGLLGIVPVALGVIGLLSALQHPVAQSSRSTASGMTGIATLQVASSFDTLAAFLPLFADTRKTQLFVIAAGFVLMSLAWLVVARLLAGSPAVTRWLRPLERFARPVVLVLVGIYVLSNTTTDLSPDEPATLEPGPPYDP